MLLTVPYNGGSKFMPGFLYKEGKKVDIITVNLPSATCMDSNTLLTQLHKSHQEIYLYTTAHATRKTVEQHGAYQALFNASRHICITKVFSRVGTIQRVP